MPSLSLLRFLVSEHCSIPGTTLGISFTDLRFHQGLTSFSNPCQANAWTCDRICQIFLIKCQCSGNSGVPSRTFGTVQKSKKQNFGYFRALFMECKFFALYFSIGRTKEIQHFTLASRRFYPFLMKSKRVKVDSKPDKPTEPQQDIVSAIPDGTASGTAWLSYRLHHRPAYVSTNRLDGSTLGTIPASFHISAKSRARR